MNMKGTNIKKKAILVLIMVTLLTALIPGNNNVIASGDDFTITGDITTPTNKDVKLEINLSDKGGSGIKEAIMPDGSKLTKTGTYTIKENGTYKFSVEDNAGNKTTGQMVVANIFKSKPTLDLSSSTELTNKDVVIKVKAGAIGEGNSIVKIVGPDGDLSGNEYIAKENGTYKFTAHDIAGNETTKEIKIDNINKVKPVITVKDYNKEWTNKNIVVSVSTDKGKLNQESYTFKENGSFTFTATDEWGNKVEKTVKIENIDKIKPKIEIKIVK